MRVWAYRSGVIRDIEKALPHLDDADMVDLSRCFSSGDTSKKRSVCESVHRVMGKLQGMTDDEFERLELTEAE